MMVSQDSSRSFSALLACFMALTVFLPCNVSAQTLNIDEIADIAPRAPLPEAEFNEQTMLLEQTPFNDESLSFSIRLPKGWVSNIKLPVEMIGEEKGASLLGVVARYVSPAKDYLRSSFSLETIKLTHNVPLKYWFTQYVLSQGYSLEAVTVHSDKKIEAIYVNVDGDNSDAVHIMAFSHGARMILVRYSVPMSRFESEKEMQAQVLSSFELLHPQSGGAEEIKTHAFLSESYFNYPSTWNLVPTAIRTIERMQVALVQGEDLEKLDGQIGVFLTNRYGNQSLQKEVRLFKEKLDIPDYKLGEYFEKRKMLYHSDMSFGVTEVYKMEPTVSTKSDYELWVSVMSNEDYYYIVSLLTPSREIDLYTWARNVEAYRIVVKTMRHFR
tara:strand:- start:1543 stop:2694 length:1152 start_codon:yes stop_codon:yes gene_type:complete